VLGNCLAELLHLFFELLPLIEVLLSCLRKLPLQLLHLRLTSNFTFGRNRNEQRNPKQTPYPGPHMGGSGAARDPHGVIFPRTFFRVVFGPIFTHCVLYFPSLVLFGRQAKTNTWQDCFQACHREHMPCLRCDARERKPAVHAGSAHLGWTRFLKFGSFERLVSSATVAILWSCIYLFLFFVPALSDSIVIFTRTLYEVRTLRGIYFGPLTSRFVEKVSV
jgi:hypothetical protein